MRKRLLAEISVILVLLMILVNVIALVVVKVLELALELPSIHSFTVVPDAPASYDVLARLPTTTSHLGHATSRIVMYIIVIRSHQLIGAVCILINLAF